MVVRQDSYLHPSNFKLKSDKSLELSGEEKGRAEWHRDSVQVIVSPVDLPYDDGGGGEGAKTPFTWSSSQEGEGDLKIAAPHWDKKGRRHKKSRLQA